MGALGCKYCNWNEENNEGKFEQINKNNNPILVTNNTNKNANENNILNINDIISNSINEEKDNNFKSINLQIDKEKETIEKSPINDNNSEKDFNNSKENNNIEDNNDINIGQDEEDFNKVIEENNIKKLKSDLEKGQPSQFSITKKTEAKNKVKNYEINKINFGLKSNDKKNLNQEQKKLYKEAETNLKQFSAPKGDEISKLQIIMSNILLKLNKFFTSINLTSSNDEYKYILLSSILDKMINYEISAHSTTLYSDRFCVLYPKTFKYYKSKERFLKNLSPMCVLPIEQISAVNLAKPKKGKKQIYHLIICNKLGIQKDSNKKIFKNAFDSSPDTDESLLIFTSDDEKNVLQWYIVIQYLIEIYKI